jgi:Beta-mannanase
MKPFSFFITAVILLSIEACTLKAETNKFADDREIMELTTETQHLLKNLRQIPSKGIMFGHQDSPLYGVGWEGDSARSDVKSVVGDYPAVMGFDIGRIELGREKNIDNVPFEKIRQEIIHQYERGGMITISWHIDNPLTDGDSWDVATKGAVASILPNGENHEKFLGWLEAAASFLKSLETKNGTKIPILFRPWHEHTGSWFWWGKENCTAEEYKQLWILTHDYFKKHALNNLLFAYSPNAVGDEEMYMERYPGDEYVDLLGLDCYHGNEEGAESYQTSLHAMLALMTEEGKQRNKPIALTETGLETIPIPDWWTSILFPVLDKYPVSYVLVWRNARERPNHYYAPYPEQISAGDFIDFYKNPKTLFCRDIQGLYQ